LPDVQDGTGDWIFQANRIGHDGPHVRVRLEKQRNALDGGGVGPLAALRQAQFNQRRGIAEPSNLNARSALAAKIIVQPLAVGGLREHARQREFPDPARAGKEQRVRHTFRAQHAPKRGDHPFVAEKF